MTERELTLLRLCVCYAIANLDDVLEAFETSDALFQDRKLTIDFNGEIIDSPTEDEIAELMKVLQ